MLLHNTLDYPSYSLAVEKIKVAFRVAYSLFDKIAFFLNDYEKLAVNPKQVYFRTIWYANRDAKRAVIHDAFLDSRNWPLGGLFWLAKDLFDPDLQETAEPDAQQLYVIRNCLEHSYLKVHEILPASDTPDPWLDRLAYSVQREDFSRKTLRLLRLSRAALIYLSLAMHDKERKRPKSDKLLKMPMLLTPFEDDWKV